MLIYIIDRPKNILGGLEKVFTFTHYLTCNKEDFSSKKKLTKHGLYF